MGTTIPMDMPWSASLRTKMTGTGTMRAPSELPERFPKQMVFDPVLCHAHDPPEVFFVVFGDLSNEQVHLFFATTRYSLKPSPSTLVGIGRYL